MAHLLRVLRGKRGGHEGFSAAPAEAVSSRVERFEYVVVEGSSTLLRVVVRVDGAEDSQRPKPVLVVTAGEEVEHREPIAPPAPLGGGRWQVAFAVQSARIEQPGTTFDLSIGDDLQVELPPPGEAIDGELDVHARLEREHALRLGAEEMLFDKTQDLADAHAILDQQKKRCMHSEHNLAALRDKLVLAWTEAAELRELLDDREATHESSKEEARRRRATERELREVLDRQESELVAARESVEQQCEALSQELARRESGEQLAREELDTARERQAALQEASREALEIYQQARSDADETRSLLDQAREASAAAAAKAEESQAEAESVKAELEAVKTQLEEARTATGVEASRAEGLSVELERLQSERAELEQQIEALRQSEQRLLDEQTRGERLNAELEQLRSELTESNQSAQLERAGLEKEIAGLRESEDALRVELERARKSLDEPTSGKRAMRKALQDAEADRNRLEADLGGLLMHLGDLEQKLAESKAFDPHVAMGQREKKSA
jgi:chromosome segregation ATPase